MREFVDRLHTPGDREYSLIAVKRYGSQQCLSIAGAFRESPSQAFWAR